MRLAVVEKTEEVTPGEVSIGEQPMTEIVEETDAEEAGEGQDTEEVTSDQEFVPERWEDYVGGEPMKSPAVVEAIPEIPEDCVGEEPRRAPSFKIADYMVDGKNKIADYIVDDKWTDE